MKKLLRILTLLCAAALLCLASACEKPRLDHQPTPEKPAVLLTKVTVGDFTYEDKLTF